MKTRQGQIEAVVGVIQRKMNKKGLLTTTTDIATAIVRAGYGKVTEYKAEIEQLKAKNNVLGDGVAKAYTNGFTDGRKQVEKDIRRAKINILRELKENAVEIYSKEFGQMEFVGVDVIDELIKEVEK